MILASIMISAGTMVMAQQQQTVQHSHQHRTFSPEQAKEMRWQKVSEKMMLSDAESAKVKPVYDEYLEELRSLRPNRNTKQEAKTGKANKAERKPATDTDIEKMVKSKWDIERKQIDIKEKYFDKFCKLLNPRQAKYLVETADVMHHQGARKGFRGKGMRMMNQNKKPQNIVK